MEKNQKLCGFAVKECTALPELAGRLWRMEHEKSGARLVWLERQEENKTFCIAFRTLPSNDTGVFHILEHSVLCGSDRYPVKEPFVELMKSSMHTFLNAMTYPDKTIYPVSSRNHKDFINLLRVYMDAVLHPLIYSKPEIFRQEGWHYEMPKDGGSPSYKGVVFNEMKGAFSTPYTLMIQQIVRSLFPDTCYRFDSGGVPQHIPELTYEQFVETHRKLYHPSNSYILLDGQMDIEDILSILDSEYLSAYDRQEGQPEFLMQKPVQSEPVRLRYEISPNEPLENKARLAWGYVLGDYTCWEETIAMSVLADALCGGNQAPLKQKILSAGLAQDLTFIVADDGLLQPIVLLEAVNLDENRAGEVTAAVREELERLVREGLDHQQLAATLANLEFKLRERDYGGMPQGLGLVLSMLESWLYGGDPAAHLEVGTLFVSLNQKLEEGYFESLLERVLLKNNHSCEVLLLPSPVLGEENRQAEESRLKAASESWSEADRAALIREQESLDAWQASADTPEALASIPTLRLEDIPAKPADIPLETGKLGDVPLLRHSIPTSGVGYINLYFDVTGLTAQQLPCVSLLCALLGELDTAKHSGLELQRLSRLYLGDIRFSIEPLAKENMPGDCRTYLQVSFSALESKLEDAVKLVAEIAASTRFDDSRKIHELLRQLSTYMEQSVIDMGNRFAMTRVAAGCSVQGAVQEYTKGITFVRWLKDLEKNFENRSAALIEELESLCKTIFTTGGLTISVTGAENACAAALERELLPRLPETARRELPCTVRSWGLKREGIVIPAGVSFSAMGRNLLDCGLPYSGTVRVAGHVVSLEYLWNTIRVQGGAYGTGLLLNASGNACFYSYRDPNAARSLDCYRETGAFLRHFCSEKPDLTGMITGAVAELDPLLTPRRKGLASDGWYFKGVDYAARCRRREELLSTTPDKLSQMVDAFVKLTESTGVCVVGPQQQLDSCGQELGEVFVL